MDLEEIEYKMEDERRIHDAGYMCKEHYEAKLKQAISGLLDYGNRFQKALGHALAQADLVDALKILRYWRQECDKAIILSEMEQARVKAENQS